MVTEATYLTDMSKCLPEDALSTIPARHKWQVVDYDAGEIAGNMVFALPLYETPAITLPLNETKDKRLHLLIQLQQVQHLRYSQSS